MESTLTPEQIEKHYAACLDSVAAIYKAMNGSGYKDNFMAENFPALLHESKQETILRNVQHLEAMQQADFWTEEDMAPIYEAIAAGNAALEG